LSTGVPVGVARAALGADAGAMDDFDRLIRDQDGLISRRQAIAAGLVPHDIARLVRRRDWAAVHDGVFVNHTGEPTWVQRAWAAVLFAWPAALSHESALRAEEGPGKKGRDDQVIHVAVARERKVRPPDGIVVHRLAHFSTRVQWNKHPPRIRFEEAVLDTAADAPDDLAAIAALADAVNARRTTGDRLLTALGKRQRIARRAWLAGVLADVAAGTCSVLEHGYLTRVERAHSLPAGSRQQAAGSTERRVFRDVEYPDQELIVELDGRLGHSSTDDRDRDFDRDLEAAADGKRTVRLAYGQVFDRPCLTAARMATVLGVEVTRCDQCGSPDSPGESEVPRSA
jgi:hypothetical protein